MASPPYSATWPVPPLISDFPDDGEDDVLGGDAGRTLAFHFDVQGLGGRLHEHCVASTCSTSLVPMPNASVPNAPWVEVWLSPQTMVVPAA